jgi:ribosomal-protein-alanine N-acetyltransferase
MPNRGGDDVFRERRMTAADIPAVAALEREVFTDAWSEEAFRSEVIDRRTSWPVVLEDEEGHLAAYMVAWLVADEVHLGNIAVAPTHRRRGLARRLLAALERKGHERGARLVTLEVRRSNEAARTLYEDLGFRTVQIRRAYYADNKEDAMVMMKRLAPDAPSGGVGV